MATRRRYSLWFGLVVVVLVAWWLTHGVCVGTWLSKGLVIEQCPDGELRQTVNANTGELRRGAPGWIRVMAFAHYTTGPSDENQEALIPKADTSVSLVDAAGKETPLPPKDAWKPISGISAQGYITLPADLADGD